MDTRGLPVPRLWPTLHEPAVRIASATAATVRRRLALAAVTPVEQLHASVGADAARSVSVSWATPAEVRGPFLHLAAERFPAQRSVRRGRYVVHHASVDGLEPDTPYPYRVGHDGVPMSLPSVVRTAPLGRARVTFTAFGDHGTNLPAGIGRPDTPFALDTVALVDGQRPDFHLVAGDLTYANGESHYWSQWFRSIESSARRFPWMPCIGNHELERNGGTAADGLGYDAYLASFALPDNGLDDLAGCFYAFRYGGVVVVCADTNDVSAEQPANRGYSDGRQSEWLERTLAAARDDPDTDAIVVVTHHASFSSSDHHGSDLGVRDAWHELFVRCGVDVVLQGHNHAYERTHPLDVRGVPAVSGPVYVSCGIGGVAEGGFSRRPRWSAARDHRRAGLVRFDLEPGSSRMAARLRVAPVAVDGSEIEPGTVIECATRRP